MRTFVHSWGIFITVCDVFGAILADVLHIVAWVRLLVILDIGHIICIGWVGVGHHVVRDVATVDIRADLGHVGRVYNRQRGNGVIITLHRRNSLGHP